MKSAFPGFSPDALTFLRNLKRNNRQAWFQPRKEHYEKQIKVPMLDLACCLSREFARFSPHYVTPPEKSVFRIYRDEHFSHDKKPYKTHIAAVFATDIEPMDARVINAIVKELPKSEWGPGPAAE